MWNTGANCTLLWKISAVHFKTYNMSNNWKRKFSNPQKEVGNHQKNATKKGRPSLAGEELLVKKEAIIGIRLTRAVISRMLVISIGNGVLKTNDPNNLSEFGGEIMLTDNLARRDLKSMD